MTKAEEEQSEEEATTDWGRCMIRLDLASAPQHGRLPRQRARHRTRGRHRSGRASQRRGGREAAPGYRVALDPLLLRASGPDPPLLHGRRHQMYDEDVFGVTVDLGPEIINLARDGDCWQREEDGGGGGTRRRICWEVDGGHGQRAVGGGRRRRAGSDAMEGLGIEMGWRRYCFRWGPQVPHTHCDTAIFLPSKAARSVDADQMVDAPAAPNR